MALQTVDVNEVYELVQFIANKDQSGNTMSPDEFNLSLRRAADDYFRWLYGLPHKYAPNFPMPAPAYELTQKIKDDMRVLKVAGDDAIFDVSAGGRMTIPDDYVAVTSIYYKLFKSGETCDDTEGEIRPVERIDDDKWAGRVSSSLKKPTKKRPICNFRNNHVQFEPKNLGKVYFEYLRCIQTPIWGYTIVNDVAVYDEASSTQLEFPKIVTNDIVRIILSYVGINLREPELLAYAEDKKANGI